MSDFESYDCAFENTGCVLGMRCPMCGSRAPYSIAATCSMTVYQGGTDVYEDVRFTDDSGCMCRVCGYVGTVREFREDAAAR